MKGFQIKIFFLKDQDLFLGPTHEEEITSIIANEIDSSKKLPLRLYQIGNKFRKELRPRGGLLRLREFLMKDLYTFDETIEEAKKTYEEISKAYENIFTEMRLPFIKVF